MSQLKKREFRNLHQGNRTVGKYVDEFNKLSRYAPDDVATDAAKQEKFLEGLNDELGMQLMVATFNNYQELVDKATILEGKQQQIESRKRKYGQGKYNSGAQQKPRYAPYSMRESWIRGCLDGRTISSAGLLDYEDTRLKTMSRDRKGLSLASKASLAIRICRSPTIVTDFV